MTLNLLTWQGWAAPALGAPYDALSVWSFTRGGCLQACGELGREGCVWPWRGGSAPLAGLWVFARTRQAPVGWVHVGVARAAKGGLTHGRVCNWTVVAPDGVTELGELRTTHPLAWDPGVDTATGLALACVVPAVPGLPLCILPCDGFRGRVPAWLYAAHCRASTQRGSIDGRAPAALWRDWRAWLPQARARVARLGPTAAARDLALCVHLMAAPALAVGYADDVVWDAQGRAVAVDQWSHLAAWPRALAPVLGDCEDTAVLILSLYDALVRAVGTAETGVRGRLRRVLARWRPVVALGHLPGGALHAVAVLWPADDPLWAAADGDDDTVYSDVGADAPVVVEGTVDADAVPGDGRSGPSSYATLAGRLPQLHALVLPTGLWVPEAPTRWWTPDSAWRRAEALPTTCPLHCALSWLARVLPAAPGGPLLQGPGPVGPGALPRWGSRGDDGGGGQASGTGARAGRHALARSVVSDCKAPVTVGVSLPEGAVSVCNPDPQAHPDCPWLLPPSMRSVPLRRRPDRLRRKWFSNPRRWIG